MALPGPGRLGANGHLMSGATPADESVRARINQREIRILGGAPPLTHRADNGFIGISGPPRRGDLSRPFVPERELNAPPDAAGWRGRVGPIMT